VDSQSHALVNLDIFHRLHGASVTNRRTFGNSAAKVPNTLSLAHFDRKTGFQPVMEDSASRLSVHETTGWKPILLLTQHPQSNSIPSTLPVENIFSHSPFNMNDL
jgi:hypothetical protein